MSLSIVASLAGLKTEIQGFAGDLSFSVRELETGKEIAEVSGSQARVPASVAKLVSSACALKSLGTDYSFPTEFGYRGQISKGVLNGDLIIQGSGDPSFVIEDLAQNLRILRAGLGLKEIKGKLIVDLSYFQKEELNFASDDFAYDDGRSFTSSLTALPFNHNSFAIWITAQKPQAHVALVPADALDYKIVNQVRVVPGTIQSIQVNFQPQVKLLTVSGQIGESAEPKAVYRSVGNPMEYFARTFANLWRESGGVWAKPEFQLVLKSQPYTSLFVHRSRPVSRLLMDINKLSTNFGAELVGLAAANKSFGSPVDLGKQTQWLKECLKTFSIPESQIVLTNASGLSRTTKMSASGLSDFLVKQRREEYFPEYLSSLSILGRDGTTRSRFKAKQGKARLKTGSIKNVRSIAGYVDSQTKGALTFALIINSNSISDAKKQDLENRVLEELLEL